MAISLGFTVQSHSYHQSSFFNSTSSVSGGIYQASNNFTTYFGLDEENAKLLEENRALRILLFNQKKKDSVMLDSAMLKYNITTGRVIKNSYADQRNYVTINRGENDGLKQDMGVITEKGILGIIENVSNKYATVQSILNEKSNINAKILNTGHFGSLIWDSKSYATVQLVDIPKLAPITIGDTIVTGAMSSIFPENIPIGVIKDYDLDNAQSFYRIDVELFNDMTNIKNVYIIENLDKNEIRQLEIETINQ